MDEELMDHTFDDIISKNYDMLKPLGDGAFSEVHLGRHLLTNTKVAVKIIYKEKTKVSNIATEVALMKLCHHVHIIKLFHVIDTPLKTLLVTEYAPGGDLLDYILTKGSLKEAEAGPLFYQVALAIDYLHERDIAHRDVKLENILIGKKGKVKLCDFGLSTVVTTQRRLLQDCGTMLYMAPEVLMGEPCNSLETDMWAVGVVLYAMLAGYRPFEHSTIPGMTELILRKSLYIPHHLSINVQDVMHCLLTINPACRITAGQLLKHPWMYQYEQLSPPCSMEIEPRQSFPKVVEAMMLMGYTLKDIIHSVGSKMYNATMGTFNILKYRLSCGDSCPPPGTSMQPCFQISPTSPDRLRRKSESGPPTKPEKWHREKGKGWRSYSANPRLCWLPSTTSPGSPAPQGGALPIDTSCESLENDTGSKSSGDFLSDPSSLSAEKEKKSMDTDHNIRACCVQKTSPRPIITGDLSQQMAATGLDEHIAGASAIESSYDMPMVSYDMVSYDISKGLFAQSPSPGPVPDGEPRQGAPAEQDNVLRDASAQIPSPGPVPDGEPPQGALAEQDNVLRDASAQSPSPGPVPDGEPPQGALAEQDNVLRDASAQSPSPGPVPDGEPPQGALAEDNVLRDASAQSPSPGPVPDGEPPQGALAEQDNVLRDASAQSPSPGPVPDGEPPQGALAEDNVLRDASAQSPSPGPVPDGEPPQGALAEDNVLRDASAQSPSPGPVPDGEPPQGALAEQDNVLRDASAHSPSPGPVPDGEPPQDAPAEQDNVLRDASAQSPSPGPVPDGEPPQDAPAEQDNVLRDASAQSPSPGPVPDGEPPQDAPAEQDNVLRDASAQSPSPGPVPDGEPPQDAPAEQDNVLRDASAQSPSPGPVPDGEPPQDAPAEQDNVLRDASTQSPSPGPVPDGELPQGALAEQDNVLRDASAQSPSPGLVPDGELSQGAHIGQDLNTISLPPVESSPGSLLHDDQLAPTAIRSNRSRGWKRFKRGVVNTIQWLCCCCCLPVSRRRRESISDEQQQAQLRGS